MKIAFHSPLRKGLTVAVVSAATLVYVGLAAREFAASWLAGRVQLKNLQRAAWLEPSDADFRNRLGRFYDLVARDPSSAIENYKAAVQINPLSARYWFDLANAYQVAGDTTRQSEALEQAIRTDPMTPDVAWEAANLYLVQGQNDKALREYHVVMANDSSLAGSAVRYCWRIDPDVDRLLQDVVPASADAYIPFLLLLEDKQETAGTVKVWNALLQTNQPFEKRYAYDYVHYLIHHKEVDQAVAVWDATTQRYGLGAYVSSSTNLVVNPGFAMNPLNAGFDWQYQKQYGVNLMLDPGEHHSGQRSLLINFDGPGIQDGGIYQFVPVQPNTKYEFSAYYKNGEIEGAGGPHFTIQDMYTQAVYYESDELKDASFWKSVYGEFTTSPDCKLIVVHVRRLPPGSPIRGKLWVADFRLTRKQS